MRRAQTLKKPTTYKNLSDLQDLLHHQSARKIQISQDPHPSNTIQAQNLSEEELFAHGMRDVNPLIWDSIRVSHSQPVEIKNETQQEESGLQYLFDFVQGRIALNLEETGEYVEGAPHPKGRLLLRNLRKGHYTVEASLDLHGLNIPDAKDSFKAFLKESLQRNRGCIRVVHGRGQHSKDGEAVLKENVQKWLCSRRLRRYIIAFTSAQLLDGGCGALYILLKNKR